MPGALGWLGLGWLGWLGSPIAHAGAVADGSTAFDQGNLDAAIAAWDQARADGATPSGVIEYDLGIAYYRKGDLPRSIARFRAAERLRPRDGAVQHNLALARAGLTNLATPASTAGWRQVVTPGELGVIGILLTALGSLGILVRRVRTAGIVGWALGFALAHGAAACARLAWLDHTYAPLARAAADPHGWVHLMGVAPARQGGGLGRAVLEAALPRAG
ncbi:MAG: tetratricopeptide repeat protein, partial [Myxococcota bacterium]